LTYKVDVTIIVAMYIRKTISKQRGKTYTNYLLVESVSTPKGPRQKTVCSLGNLGARPAGQWLKLAHKIESALAGQCDLIKDTAEETRDIIEKVKERLEIETPVKDTDEVISVHVDKVETARHREGGSVHVGHQFWKKLGIADVLGKAGLGKKERILTCAMTLNRLIMPLSENAMPEWIRSTAMEDILGVDFGHLSEDALYRNLDRLYPGRSVIESALVESERNLFNLEPAVFFYDITSTYFEGQAKKNHKAKRGYSRDSRPDCKQVLVGLAIGKEGFPLAHEVMEGNLQDRETLDGMLQLMEQRVGLKEGQTVVIDRGMAFEDNIKQIRERNLHYIVASRQTERDEWLSEFDDLEGFEEIHRRPSPLNPFQKKTKVLIKKIRQREMTYVLCVSDGRMEKDKAIRQKQEQRLLCDIEKLSKRINKGRLVDEAVINEAIGRIKERYPRVARYYKLKYNKQGKELICKQDRERMKKAEVLDGSYLLKTDRIDLSADEIWRIYMTLTRAEAAFRAMKSPLSERPIFHQIDRRVETHIFLCVLAYHLLVAIENTMLDKGIHTSWWTMRQILRTHQVCTIMLPATNGKMLTIRKASKPEPEHLELYKLLGISSEIIPPKKTWVSLNKK